jgi:hypothetical protein
VRHGGRCRQTMFTKQVSGPLAQRGFPVVAAEAEQVERTRRKTWSQAESRVSVPFSLARWTVGIPTMAAEAEQVERTPRKT